MNEQTPRSAFVPMLYLHDLAAAIDFYSRAFGAAERWRINNPDGTTHVAELSISSLIVRLHEETAKGGERSPATVHATTIVIGLLVDDPDKLARQAVAAGATELSRVQEYDYGYRQGTIRDPFGHHWCIERLDDLYKKPLGVS